MENFLCISLLHCLKLQDDQTVLSSTFYFCSLAEADFDLTGEYFSRIAAAAVFIAYNKHARAVDASVGNSINTAPREDQFPEMLHKYSGYSAIDLKHVVEKLLELAKHAEEICNTGNQKELESARGNVPLCIHQYYKRQNVVHTGALLGFGAYYAKPYTK